MKLFFSLASLLLSVKAAELRGGVKTHSSLSFEFSESTYQLTEQEVEDDGNFCDSSSKSLSGYVDVTGSKFDAKGEGKHLFYWMYEKRAEETVTNADDVPFIVWLTGGPGCSSSLALLTENGPCKVNKDGKSTTVNPHSWTESANVLWLDQPAGVGYSYGEATDKNEEMVSEDAYYFLQTFFQAHPEYAKNPLYIVGESYGGHYAPSIAHRVWMGNKAQRKGTMSLNLAGVAVGNGLTNPEEQYKWYPEMAFKNSHGIQAIDEPTYNAMKEQVPKCQEHIHKCNAGSSMRNTFACETAFVECNMQLTNPYHATGLNPYDIRKECGDNPLCYDFSPVETFLNLDSTKEALHVTSASAHWETCNNNVHMKFNADYMKDFSPYISDLLNDGLPVLIYSGDVDFICNYMGNRAWTLALDWDNKEAFNSAEDHDWSNGKGLARSSNGFTFLQVYDAGHMVPTDQPEVALDMITAFTSGKVF